MAKNRSLELGEQIALFQWAKLRPLINDHIFHVPNGGYRTPWQAYQFKRAGVKPGVPDIFLEIPIPPFHGLRIELKVNRNKVTPGQAEWLERLNKMGYYTYTAYGWEDAKECIENYLAGKLCSTWSNTNEQF